MCSQFSVILNIVIVVQQYLLHATYVPWKSATISALDYILFSNMHFPFWFFANVYMESKYVSFLSKIPDPASVPALLLLCRRDLGRIENFLCRKKLTFSVFFSSLKIKAYSFAFNYFLCLVLSITKRGDLLSLLWLFLFD